MAGAFARSAQLMRESFAILKKDKEMLWFPALSSFFTIILFFSFIFPMAFAPGSFEKNQGLVAGLLFLYYLFSYFIVIFFNTGLITCAHIRLHGGDPTVKDGITNAFKHIGKIFAWAVVASTVGVILHHIAEKSRGIGRLFAGLLGIAWSLLTFFVVPVLIFEKLSVVESIKKSGAVFKKTWGENVLGQFTFGAFFLFLTLLGLLPFFFAFISQTMPPLSIILIIILYWVLLGILSSTLNGIFVTALYLYATTGKVPAGYSKEIVETAFVPGKR
ncbi:hypothetical protein HYV84_00045 [Candidatus Woesearchaeota archaeon]|nr:hypothetical protein [Candidatus Woesearchaeota archaeon]